MNNHKQQDPDDINKICFSAESTFFLTGKLMVKMFDIGLMLFRPRYISLILQVSEKDYTLQ